MSENHGSEQEGYYDILQNATGDLLIAIRARSGEPANSRIVYDGQKHALLYRQQGFSITLDFIHPDVRGALARAAKVLVVEFENKDVVREYEVPVRYVKKMPISTDMLLKK